MDISIKEVKEQLKKDVMNRCNDDYCKPYFNSVYHHNMTESDTELLGGFCDLFDIHGEKLLDILINGYLINILKVKTGEHYGRVRIKL